MLDEKNINQQYGITVNDLELENPLTLMEENFDNTMKQMPQSKRLQQNISSNWRGVFDTTPLPEENERETPAQISSISFTSQSKVQESDEELCQKMPTMDNDCQGRPVNENDLSSCNVVEHNYIDYSQVNDEEAEYASCSIIGTGIKDLLYCNSIPIATPISKPEPCKIAISDPCTFPKKLYIILSIPQYNHIVRWLPHGRSFIICDPVKLAKDIFPKFFKLKKYNSFIRQLSLWGFKRLTTRSEAKSSYYSPFFLRGRPCLMSRMKLILVKGTGKKMKSNPETEPNFSELSKIRPLPEIDSCVVDWYQANLSDL